MNSVLEERFSLQDLLDLGVLREVCEAYAHAFNFGVRLYNDKGDEECVIVPAHRFCSVMRQSKFGPRCLDVDRRLVKHPLEGSQVLQLKTFCGLKYALFPLSYQLEILGRAVVGPFRDPATTPDTVLTMIKEAQTSLTAADIAVVPAPSPEQLKSAIGLLARILNAFLFINAKRLITTRLHLESIYSSREQIFRQVQTQDSGSKEDREEIERLKDLF
jgi:hypothetical protein